MATHIIGNALPDIPWRDKPAGHVGVLCRDDRNPIIGWSPTPKSARIFNSAVVPWADAYIGVFRADHRDGKPQLHVGHSTNALDWEFDDEEIGFVDESGAPYQPKYAYDPRVGSWTLVADRTSPVAGVLEVPDKPDGQDGVLLAQTCDDEGSR